MLATDDEVFEMGMFLMNGIPKVNEVCVSFCKHNPPLFWNMYESLPVPFFTYIVPFGEMGDIGLRAL
jgi:hypothetical protein